MRVSVRSLAKTLGLAPSTVSRALRDDPRIAPATRHRIQAAARDAAYLPDPVYRVFQANRRHLKPNARGLGIGLVFRSRSEIGEARPGFAEARAAAQGLGYQVESVDLSAFDSERRASSVLFHRNVRGLILFPSARTGQVLDFEWRHFSVVLSSPSLVPHPGHLVTYNGFLQARMAWQTLARAGRRRIGVVIVDTQLSPNDAAMIGACLVEAWRDPSQHPIPPLHQLPPDLDALRRWFDQHQPDAVIGMHDGIYWNLRDNGVTIPEATAFISLHVELRYPEIAGFAITDKRVAPTAVDVLDRLIRLGERGLPSRPTTTIVDPEWRPGPSCPYPCADSLHG